MGNQKPFPLLGHRFDRRSAFDDLVVEPPARIIDENSSIHLNRKRFHDLEKSQISILALTFLQLYTYSHMFLFS